MSGLAARALLPLTARSLLLLALATTTGGCVPLGRLDSVRATRNEALDANRKLAAQVDQMRSEGELANEARGNERLEAARARAELTDRNAVLSHTNDELTAERNVLGARLDASTAKTAVAGRAQRAAELRALTFRNLALKLKRMTDAGTLAIHLRDGRMVLVLSNDVLFESGSAAISKAGEAALAQIATVLRDIPERHFQVAGHTDTRPIQTPQFASNWELSTARGTQVVRFLASAGVPPSMLSAAGYGEFDPVASNDTEAARLRNRRIEIVLVPSINELISVP